MSHRSSEHFFRRVEPHIASALSAPDPLSWALAPVGPRKASSLYNDIVIACTAFIQRGYTSLLVDRDKLVEFLARFVFACDRDKNLVVIQRRRRGVPGSALPADATVTTNDVTLAQLAQKLDINTNGHALALAVATCLQHNYILHACAFVGHPTSETRSALLARYTELSILCEDSADGPITLLL